jgi:hypothetical protein
MPKKARKGFLERGQAGLVINKIPRTAAELGMGGDRSSSSRRASAAVAASARRLRSPSSSSRSRTIFPFFFGPREGLAADCTTLPGAVFHHALNPKKQPYMKSGSTIL